MARAGSTDNNNSKPKTTRTTVTIPNDNYQELERLADRKKVSVAWVIREAVEVYLSQQSPLFFHRSGQ